MPLNFNRTAVTENMKIAVVFAIIGTVLLGWAAKLEPYKDSSIMNNAMTTYPTEKEDSHAVSKRYWAVRDAQLTPKFALQNYGLTLLIIALVIVVAAKIYSIHHAGDLMAIKTPDKSWKVTTLGLIIVVLAPIIFVASIMLEASRNEYPPWADSLGIPIFQGTPVIFMGALMVVWFFSVLGCSGFHGRQRIAAAFRRESRPSVLWHILLGSPLVISVAVTAIVIVNGEFLLLIPSILMMVFFVIFFAGKQKLPN
jgi:hypothetical protein